MGSALFGIQNTPLCCTKKIVKHCVYNQRIANWWKANADDLDVPEAESEWAWYRPAGYISPLHFSSDYIDISGPDIFSFPRSSEKPMIRIMTENFSGVTKLENYICVSLCLSIFFGLSTILRIAISPI